MKKAFEQFATSIVKFLIKYKFIYSFLVLHNVSFKNKITNCNHKTKFCLKIHLVKTSDGTSMSFMDDVTGNNLDKCKHLISTF